jgi:serine protease Do
MLHKKRLVPLALAVLVAGTSLVSLVNGQAATANKPYATEKLTELKSAKPTTAEVKSPSDLKAIEERVEIITRNALPAIVNIQITMQMPDGTLAGEQGSGVIVSEDGYVLTAGHVSGEPKQQCTIVLSNGTRLGAVTMGANSLYDSGMIKITSRPDAKFPFMPMGSISKMKAGDWVIAMGHPGGLQRGRAPVVRLGKVLQIIDRRATARNGEWFFQTDCPLIMGDSGGPVFDLEGKVVGINSKIGLQTTSNIHVPIDTFEDTWDRLAKSEKWGPSIFANSPQAPIRPVPDATPPRATLNANVVDDPSLGIVVRSVREDKAADKAKISAGDIIAKVDGTIVKTYDDLKKMLSAHKPGDIVTLDLLAGGSTPNSKSRQVRVTLDAADR